MRSTIDGNQHSISTTRDTGIGIAILRYLQFHVPDDRGQQVLIYLEDDELFDGAVNRPTSPTEEHVIAAMVGLAQTVNEMWAEMIKDYVPFDEVNNLPLPDPKDIKLEVVREGVWDGQIFVPQGLAFQILTKPWVGARPFEGGYIHENIYIPI